MQEKETTEILKSAILFEKRGHAFYSQVAQHASGKAVKAFFEMMAQEENQHIQILSNQYKAYQTNQKFDPGDYDDESTSDISKRILTQDIKKEIAAADFEAAAISAAMSMEKNAIELYSQRAETTADSDEKALYQWLAKWETQHLNFLADIDKEITQQIWFDNSFWPF